MKSIVRKVQKNEVNQQKIFGSAWRVWFSAYFFGTAIKPKQAKDSETQPNKAVISESKPKKLKQAKEVQRLIEQGDVSGALAEAGLTKKKIPMPESHQGVASGDGKRSKRITILMSEEERKYINREARRHGMTIGQFVYALAAAAADGKIELEDFLED